MMTTDVDDPPHSGHPITKDPRFTNPTPQHISFPAHGRSVVTCLLLADVGTPPSPSGLSSSEKQPSTESRKRIVSGADDHSIYVHSLSTGKREMVLEGHEGGVWALATSGGLLVSGSTDGTVRIWDLGDGEQAPQSESGSGESNSGNGDPSAQKGRCLHVFYGHTSTVRCLAIVEPGLVDVGGEYGGPGPQRKERSPERPLIISGSRDHSMRVWKLPSKGEPEYKCAQGNGKAHRGESCDAEENPYHLFHLKGHDHAVRAVAARGRTLVSGSYDCTVRAWDIATGTCTFVLVGHKQKVYSVILHPIQHIAFSGSMDGTVRVWSTLNGSCLNVLTGHTSLVGLLGISPSYLVSASADSTLRVWDVDRGDCKAVLTDHTGAITCFQHDEFKVVSASDGTLKIWDLHAATAATVGPGPMAVPVRNLLTGVTGVWQVAFEGRWCVAASNQNDRTVMHVWDFETEDGRA